MKLTKICVALSIAILVFSGTAVSADTPGVTDTEVTVGWSCPLSGPGALWGVTSLGAQAWADHVNEKGGIHGRKIKMIVKDDAYVPSRAAANLQEMKGQIFALLALFGTAASNTNKDFFFENKMPCVLPYGNVRVWEGLPKEKRHWAFVAYPDYEDEGEYLINYAVKELGTKKVAVFIQNDDYGKGGLAGVEKGLKALAGKAELAAVVPHELTETSLGSHAFKLKESAADTVVLYTNPKHAALISKEMVKAGYSPKRLGTFTLADPIIYSIAGETWEGTYVALPANSGLPGTDPEANKVVDILLSKNPKIKGKEYLGLFGAINMMHFIKGLENAGRDLTVDSFIKGMEQIKDWNPQGVGAPVTYSPDRRQGVNGCRIGQAQGGSVKALTGYTIFNPRF